MSRLTRTSLLLAVFFALDKGVAILRQVVIARQFGLSRELDVFNVANNAPDLLYALISGGALSVAFIPVLAQVLTRDGRSPAWGLFSRIANLAFLVTGTLALVVSIFAVPLVRTIIAPGFIPAQQTQVVHIMRMDLIATMIFSISGLVMAGLQANQHFLLPAMAPLLYNTGQIFGALVLAPKVGYHLAGITLPAAGLGIEGLVYGVIMGAVLHLGIQVPGLIRYGFRWIPGLGLRTGPVLQVLALMGPRLVTVGLIQSVFVLRDNLASRLQVGAATALTVGWMIMQVPETLIGTAIGTAMLPTLSEENAREDQEVFRTTVERAVQVLLALTLPIAVLLSIGLRPLIHLAFSNYTPAEIDLVMWVTRGFLAGLMGQSILEVVARAFYARQNAIIPLIAAGFNIVVYVILGTQLYRALGPAGISLTDSIAFTSESALLIVLLNRRLDRPIALWGTLLRAALGSLLGAGVIYLVTLGLGQRLPALVVSLAGMILGALVALPFIWKEIRLLLKL